MAKGRCKSSNKTAEPASRCGRSRKEATELAIRSNISSNNEFVHSGQKKAAESPIRGGTSSRKAAKSAVRGSISRKKAAESAVRGITNSKEAAESAFRAI